MSPAAPGFCAHSVHTRLPGFVFLPGAWTARLPDPWRAGAKSETKRPNRGHEAGQYAPANRRALHDRLAPSPGHRGRDLVATGSWRRRRGRIGAPAMALSSRLPLRWPRERPGTRVARQGAAAGTDLLSRGRGVPRPRPLLPAAGFAVELVHNFSLCTRRYGQTTPNAATVRPRGPCSACRRPSSPVTRC